MAGDVAPDYAHLTQEELDALEAESRALPGEDASKWASRAAGIAAAARETSARRAAADAEAKAAGLEGTADGFGESGPSDEAAAGA